jgi:hypothetical protein
MISQIGQVLRAVIAVCLIGENGAWTVFFRIRPRVSVVPGISMISFNTSFCWRSWESMAIYPGIFTYCDAVQSCCLGV